METKSVNILCATDDNYAALCGIMLSSLLENNGDILFNIFILTEGLDEEKKDKYCSLEEKYNAKITILQVNKSQFEKCPLWAGDHLSVAAYYRLMAPELLPQEVDKVLYLDCDIIIHGSIKTLWSEDVREYAIGAVLDAQFYNEEFYERLNIPKESRYFNSGVMLMNLKYWRCNNVTERCFDCINKNRQILKYHDQDTLNLVLKDETKLLPIKYNLQSPFLMQGLQERYSCIRNEIRLAIEKPIIIHYIGGGKPWLGLSFHPFRAVFFKYRQKSLWRNCQLSTSTINISEKVKFLLINILILIGIRKGPDTFINVKKNLTFSDFIFVFREL